jgi:membrane protein CcdC involved in cytochrome C biogenesis
VTTATKSALTRWPEPKLFRVIAWTCIVSGAVGIIMRLRMESSVGLTAGGTYAFGDDFICFWSGPRLALLGRFPEAYDFERFHQFAMSVLGGPIHMYHYDYPPSMALLMLPFALLPYVGGLAAWFFGGCLAFAAVVRKSWPIAGAGLRDPMLYALAMPALLMNALSGQTGAWTAGLLGGGLVLLERQPILAGVLLGLLSVKPQIALLLPVALLFGRQWRALASFVGVVAVLLTGSALAFGLDVWHGFFERVAVLRGPVLEDGAGLWHLFASVFVFVRHLPAPLPVAYAVQAAVSLAAVASVIVAWRSRASARHKNAVLVMAICFATPYILVYDLVVTALVPLWLYTEMQTHTRLRGRYRLAFALLILTPMISPGITQMTGINIGCLLLLPAAIAASYACRRSRAQSDWAVA